MLDYSLNNLAQDLLGAPSQTSTSTSYSMFEDERRRNMAEVAAGPVDPTQLPQLSLGVPSANGEAGAGRGYVNPKYVLKKEPVAPVADTAAYNASIAQQESGGRADIGFHDKSKSSAFGTYGLTSGAYQDARKLNPNLPADITQATPEQQTQAQDAFTQQNAKYLQSYGVEVNPNTLAAAHFLGAKGLSDYLRDGTISPAAAKANGGEDKVREIVNKRLGGQAAPASGAVQAPVAAAPEAPTQAAPISPEAAASQAAPAAEAFTGQGLKTPGGQTLSQLQQERDNLTVLNSTSQDQIGRLAFDTNASPEVRKAAFDKLYNTQLLSDRMNKAQQTVDSLGQNPSPAALNKAMNNKETGSYVKVLMYQLLGWNEKARQELNKIDPAVVYSTARLSDNQNYSVKYNKDTNEVMSAWDSAGKPVTDSTVLGQIAAQGGGGDYDIVGGTFVNDKTGEVGSVYRSKKNPTDQFVMTETGRKPLTGFRPQGQSGTLDMQRVSQIQKQNIDLAGDWEKARIAIAKAGPKASAEEAAKFNFKFGTNFTPQQFTGVAPQVDVTTGQMIRPGMAAPAPETVTQSVAPAPGVTSGGAVSPQAARPSAGVTPASIEVGQVGAEAAAKEFVKFSAEDITPKADAGSQVARIRKAQIKGPDGILANPELAGILQGQGGTGAEVLNIIRDTVTGNFKEGEELSRRINALNLTQRQKDVLNTQIGLATSLNPLTLKANAGPGAVSDAEQKANRQANVDIARSPLYTGLTLMTRSQFTNDLSVARAEFKAARPDLNTTEKFNSAWNTEKSRLNKEYDAIYEARAKYIAQYNKDGKNPGAVVDAYKYYPVPEYDSETKTWTYGGYSDKAKRPKLDSFVR
jgi:hypothetical protein